MYSPLVKNICRKSFIISARKVFHNFETSLDDFSTLWPLKQDQLILHKESRRQNSSQNKFATPENKRNKNRKVMFNSEILAVQISLPPHPYYSVSLCRRQEKLYESFLRSKLAAAAPSLSSKLMSETGKTLRVITPGSDTLHTPFHIYKETAKKKV